MKIAIDARWISPEISGVEEYTRQLIRHLALLDRHNAYMLLFHEAALRDRTLPETGAQQAENFSTRLVPYGVFSPRNQLSLPRVLREAGIDVYHSTNYMIPFRAFPRRHVTGIQCVVTIHDVIPLILPQQIRRSKKAKLMPVYRRLMREVGIRADAVITDSLASRDDIIRHLGIPAVAQPKVTAIPCGVSDRFQPDREAMDRRAGNTDASRTRALLYVGRSDPYKNITGLVEAFATARRSLPFPVSLKIVGSPDPRYPEAQQLAERLGLRDAVEWTGYVPDSELEAAYRSSDVLVHPSRYEGFGLQVLEAMACGLPVICSNAGSLPEVAGDAAILLDPDDVCGFARRIVNVLSDPALARSLSEKGIRRAAAFTWSRTASATLDVYRRVHEPPAAPAPGPGIVP